MYFWLNCTLLCKRRSFWGLLYLWQANKLIHLFPFVASDTVYVFSACEYCSLRLCCVYSNWQRNSKQDQRSSTTATELRYDECCQISVMPQTLLQFQRTGGRVAGSSLRKFMQCWAQPNVLIFVFWFSLFTFKQALHLI